MLDELETLVANINLTNLREKTESGVTLTEALARRDALIERHKLLQAAVTGAVQEAHRYGLAEIKWVSVVDVPALQRRSDELAKQIRELNAEIQAVNWSAEFSVVKTKRKM